MELEPQYHTYQGRVRYMQTLGEMVSRKIYTLRQANAMLDTATINGELAFESNVRFRGVGITPDNKSVPYRWVNGEWEVDT